MTLQDSILFNKKGLPVLRLTPYSKNYNKTVYFYDQKGRPYLNIYVVLDSDTLYTLNQYNSTELQIQYKVREKEIEYLIEKEVIPISDSIVQLKKIQYQQEWKLKKIVPTKSLDMLIQLTNDSLVSVETKVIRYEDSLNSSTYKSKLRIKNNALILEDMNDQFKYDADGFWIERENKFLKMKRLITYYEPKEEEIKIDFSPNKKILKHLYSQMKLLPKQAWKNYNEKQNAYKKRLSLFQNHAYGDSIVIKEARTLEAFLPKLWFEVSVNSGEITGIDSLCYVVGYNTPIIGNNGSFLRNLAIYEYREGKYRLIKQSFYAIDSFEDMDNDLLFDGYDESNFSVSIQDGHIVINYEYMRGEAVNEYAYENGNWILVYASSSHRTCCSASISSYDYRTKTLTESTFPLGEEDYDDSTGISRDTVITTIEDRPVIYMDQPF